MWSRLFFIQNGSSACTAALYSVPCEFLLSKRYTWRLTHNHIINELLRFEEVANVHLCEQNPFQRKHLLVICLRSGMIGELIYKMVLSTKDTGVLRLEVCLFQDADISTTSTFMTGYYINISK